MLLLHLVHVLSDLLMTLLGVLLLQVPVLIAELFLDFPLGLKCLSVRLKCLSVRLKCLPVRLVILVLTVELLVLLLDVLDILLVHIMLLQIAVGQNLLEC